MDVMGQGNEVEIEGFRLSPQQEQVWRLQRGGSLAHQAWLGVRLLGDLDLDVLEAALVEVTQRHESLRSSFLEIPHLPFPLQVVHEEAPQRWRLLDLSLVDRYQQDLEVEALLEQETTRSWRLVSRQLMRITLVRLGIAEHLLLLHLPALCADYHTLETLMAELATCYQPHEEVAAYARPMPYTQFAEWQKQLLELDEASEERQFWAQKDLEGFGSLRLPFEHRRPLEAPFLPRHLRWALSPTTLYEIGAFLGADSHATGAFAFSTWLILLGRLCDQSRVGVAYRSNGRAYEDLEQTLGLFEKYLPVQEQLHDERSFLDLLHQVQATLQEVEDWQEYFEWSQVFDQDLAPFCFELRHWPRKLESADIEFEAARLYACSHRFKLKLSCVVSHDGLSFELHYDPEVYRRRDIQRLADEYETLLRSAGSDPGRPLRQLELLSQGERQALLREFTGKDAAGYARRPLHEWIQETVHQYPERTAVVCGHYAVSFRELEQRANRLAHLLQHLGAGPEVLVGISMERSAELVVGLLAILKAGAVYVPLDPEYPRQRLEFMLQDSRVPILLTQERLAVSLPSRRTTLVLVGTDGTAQALDRRSEDGLVPVPPPDPGDEQAPDVDLRGDAGAYAIYTSGSTGQPKAALISHGAIVNRLQWMQEAFHLDVDDTVIQKTPFSFDVSVWEFFWPLMTGARLVLARPGGHRDAAYLVRLVRRQAVSVVHFVPSMLQFFVGEAGVAHCDTLRLVVCSGEPLPPDLEQRTLQSLQADLYNLYGPTEAAVDVTSWRCVGEDGEGDSVPIGRPITNIRILLLDEELQPVPVGVPGELYIAGAGLGRGYLGRPALTAQAFVPDPFSTSLGDRMYRTGDLARGRSDGAIDFLGRTDAQVKIRGFRVEPGEIEAVLSLHEGLRQCAVVPREDLPGDLRLVAYYVPSDSPSAASMPGEAGSEPVTPQSLRAWLSRQVPEYLVPAAFVPLPQLPLTPSGKLDRKSLPAPERALGRSAAPPRDATEELMVEVWCKVLGLDTVGIHDDFLELGGDSILSLQIVAAANQAGLSLVPAHLFQHRTIATLAEVAGSAAIVQAEQEPVAGPVPLTPIQRWFFERHTRRPEHWNQSLQLVPRHRLESVLLSAAVSRLEVLHDALRLRFEHDSHGWHQRCLTLDEAAAEGDRVLAVDLSTLPPADRPAALAATAARLQASLALGGGPLLRLALIELGQPDGVDAEAVHPEGAHPEGADPEGLYGQRLLIILHHLVVDGLSWRVLLSDLEQLYAALEAGETPQMPAKTASYRQWSEALALRAQEPSVAGELEYWLALPWDDIVPLPLDAFVDGELLATGPADVEELAQCNTVESAETLILEFSAEDTHSLLTAVPRAYRTEIDDVLITALARTLSRWTGSTSLLFDHEGHGRGALGDALDVSRTVGWFTSLFPVVLDFAQGSDPGAALVSVKEQLRRLPEGGSGYGMLRYLDSQGDAALRLRQLPAAQVLFNYLGQVDRGRDEDSQWQPLLADTLTLGERAPEGRRSHPLEVDALVREGRLRVRWTYSKNLHRPETIARVAEFFDTALTSLIRHCLEPERGGYTASDFAAADLPAPQLDALLAELGGGAVVEDIYPLATSQEGMLVYLLLQGEHTEVFTNQLHCRLSGPLDLAAFQRAWQQTVDRHAALRTLFRWEGLEHPIQVVRDRAEPEWQIEDWRQVPPAEQRYRLDRFLEDDRARSFDLRRAPLLRLTLLHTGEQVYHFVWTYHHLVLDGWSLSMLLKEVFELYRAASIGRQAQLLAAQPYGDYVRHVRGQDPAAEEAFWRQALAGLQAPPPLRIERHGSALPEGEREHGSADVQLSEEATSALQAAARRQRLTLNTLFQGAWALLLHRYSGSRDVVFGAVVSGRQIGFQSVVGLFINALPVRLHVDPEMQLAPWLEELQSQQVEQRDFEHVPLEQIQRWSGLPRDTALFDSLVVFENYPVDDSLQEGAGDPGAGRLEVSAVEVEESTNYPLALFVFPGSRLSVRLVYERATYDAGSMQLLAEQLVRQLERCALSPRASLAELLAPLSDERRRVVRDWNRTETPFDYHGDLVDLIDQQAQTRPDALAVLSAEASVAGPATGDPSQALSYARLVRWSRQLAAGLHHELQDRGEGEREPVVGIWLERRPEVLPVLLAALRAGIAYLPLDPDWPVQRVQEILADAGASLLLTSRQRLAQLDLPESVRPVVLESTQEAGAGWSLLEAQGSTRRLEIVAGEPSYERPDPASLAYIIYTSGTTGRPRGVMVHRGALDNFVRDAANAFDVGPQDRVLQFASLAFDASVEEIFPALIRGSTLSLRDDAMLESPAAFHEACYRRHITVLDLPTAWWHRLVAADRGRVPVPSCVRLIILGGERARPEHVLSWRRHVGERVRLVNTYGPTEATVVATRAELTAADDVSGAASDELAAGGEVPIGRPIANVCAYVLDAGLQPQEVGMPGELCLGGAGVARGYLGLASRTATSFLPDPFAAEIEEDSIGSASGVLTGAGLAIGARLYRTGDLVRWQPSGQLEFLGRLDQQIKVRGYRIEPDEVSLRLEMHPQVHEAAVVALPDPLADSPGEARLVAYVVFASQGATGEPASDGLDEGRLRTWLRTQLPAYMEPASFVELAQLPRTAGGKVDQRALPAPDEEPGERGNYVAPRNETEEAVAAIFSMVLGVERVGAFDDFFALGGHSLLATQLVAQVRDAFEVDLPLRLMFEAPTVARLAAEIASLILEQLEQMDLEELELDASPAEEPLAAEPSADEPFADEPSAEEPFAEESLMDEPLAAETRGESAVETPAVDDADSAQVDLSQLELADLDLSQVDLDQLDEDELAALEEALQDELQDEL